MSKVFVIAEAGVNHNGSIEVAKELVDVAARAGADAVKFQTFKAENLVCKNAEKAIYQMETTDTSESQFEMLKKLEGRDTVTLAYVPTYNDFFQRVEIQIKDFI